jgi:TetR/AcrR family transcriptional repressor of mexJK operon
VTDHQAITPARTPRRADGASEAGGFRALQPIEPDDQYARAARKRAQIQRAAIGQFLQRGYAGTSMDDITAAARVSKQTVYKHFDGKEGLFLAIINDTVGEVLDEFFHRMDLRFGDPADLEHDLCAIARRFLGLIMRPELLALRRLVIGEAGRFPQLGDVWWQGGPARIIAGLAPHLRRVADQGELAIDDPDLAAQQLNWLVLSIPLNQAMFRPARQFTQAELDHHADVGVRTFLAAYRPGRPQPARPPSRPGPQDSAR